MCECNKSLYDPLVDYCCCMKKQLSVNRRLFTKIITKPQFVVFQSPRICETTTAIIKVTNDYHIIRQFYIRTNFPDFISYKTNGNLRSVIPDATFRITVLVEPYEKITTNNRYSIFLHSKHPNLILEIPIIVLCPSKDATNLPTVAAPKFIKMARTTPRIHSYYAFPIVNYYKCGISYKLGSDVKLVNFAFGTDCHFIFPNTIQMIYLSGYSVNECELKTDMLIRFGDGISEKFHIKVLCEMKPYIPYISETFIVFDQTYLGMTAELNISICNEMDHPIKYKWCRRPNQDKCCTIHEHDRPREEPKAFNEVFYITPQSGILDPCQMMPICIKFVVPKKVSEFDSDYPFRFTALAYLECSLSPLYRKPIELHGTGIGPKIEFLTHHINLGEFYIGQLKTCEAYAKNLCPIGGKISFLHFDTMLPESRLEVQPNELDIDPGDTQIFTLLYCASTIGSFVDKVTFKIKYALTTTIVLEGKVLPLFLKTVPEFLNFEKVSICLLQQMSLAITNVLPIPIIVKCCIDNDGTESPFFLNVNVDPLVDLQTMLNLLIEASLLENTLQLIDSSRSSSSIYTYWVYDSLTNMKPDMKRQTFDESVAALKTILNAPYEVLCDNLSTCSDDNKEFLLSNLSNLNEIIKTIHAYTKTMKFYDNITINEISIIREILEQLRNTKLFINFITAWDNFVKVDWNQLPSDPKEFIIDKNEMYLEPFETKHIIVCLIPNVSGHFKKILNIISYPLVNCISPEVQNDKQEDMTTRIPIIYDSSYPRLRITNNSIDIDIYVELSQEFKLFVNNEAPFNGFIHFSIRPMSDFGEIVINPWKHLIKCCSVKIIDCTFIAKLPGQYILSGVASVLGSPMQASYRLNCNIKPPEIDWYPKKIFAPNEQVLKYKFYYIFIKNICPTIARFQLSFQENVAALDLYPLGGQLAPGQTVYIRLRTFFYDSGKLRNKILINLKHFGVIEIPMKFCIQGVPIVMEPCTENGLDYGNLLLSKCPHEFNLKFYNYGEITYRINIRYFVAPTDDGCIDPNPPIQFNVSNFSIPPKDQYTTIISINSDKQQRVLNTFLLTAFYELNRKLCFCKLRVTANIVRANIKWDRNDLLLDVEFTEYYCSNRTSDTVTLTNKAQIQSFVELQASEHISLIKIDPMQLHDRKNDKKLSFNMDACESIKILIVFEENHIQHCLEQYMDRVLVYADGVPQKFLAVITSVHFPTLNIHGLKHVLFTNGVISVYNLLVCCAGFLKIHVQWKLKSLKKISAEFFYSEKTNLQQNFSEMIFRKSFSYILTKPVDIDDELYRSQLASDIYDLDEYEDFGKKDSNSTVLTARTNVTTKTSATGRTTASNKTAISKKDPSKKKQKEAKPENEDLPPSVPPQPVTCEEVQDAMEKYFKVTNTKYNTCSTSIFNRMCYYDSKCSMVKSPRICNRTDGNDSGILLSSYYHAIDPGTHKEINIYFNCLDEIGVEAVYDANVICGCTKFVHLKIYNSKVNVGISKTKFELGIKPWYEMICKAITFSNECSVAIKVHLSKPKLNILDGYVDINFDEFHLQPYEKKEVKIRLCMCMQTYYNESIGIEVNDRIAVPIIFKGISILPWLSIFNVNRVISCPKFLKLEYKTLNSMYKNYIVNKNEPETYLDDWKSKEFLIFLKEFETNYLIEFPKTTDLNHIKIIITIYDEQIQTFIDNDVQFIDMMETDFIKCYSINPENGQIIKGFHKLPNYPADMINTYDQLLNDFVAVDYPNEYPDALTIEREIDKHIFLQSISKAGPKYDRFIKCIKNYVTHKKPEPNFCYKSFIVRPLQHHTNEYEIELGEIILNDENQYKWTFVFHGPGNMILSLRSTTKLPDFEMTFECSAKETIDSSNIYIFNSKHELEEDSVEKYINYFNRITNDYHAPHDCDSCLKASDTLADCIKICHAHSYDFTKKRVHAREILKHKQKRINDHYTKLNQGFKEAKNPFILSELYQLNAPPTSVPQEINAEIKLKFTPNTDFYGCADEVFDEYVFIDIHLGPIIPISLRGVFFSESDLDVNILPSANSI